MSTPDVLRRALRLLRHGHSTLVGDLGRTLTTKSGNLVVLCGPDGDIDNEINSGHGLYFHDMRHLGLATLRIQGERLSVLLSSTEHHDRSICELTNPDLHLDGGNLLPMQGLGVKRERALSDRMVEVLTIQNFSGSHVAFWLQLEYGATFEDMFVVRGHEPGRRGQVHPPAWEDGVLALRYSGADGRERTTRLSFDRPPDRQGPAGTAGYHMRLPPGGAETVSVTGMLADEGPGTLEQRPVPVGAGTALRPPAVETDNQLFDRVLARSFDDLHMLLTTERGDTFFAAGVPWFVALFGRDCLVTALEILAFDPGVAASTLDLLARYQGDRDDEARDEQPGKILHELRSGEMANLGEVPQTPYYGTVDATLLFLVLLAEYVRWTGDLDVWHRLRGHAQRALDWIDRDGDHDGDGFIDYEVRSAMGLANQGWKDSYNAIAHPDGRLAAPPIALVEVQGDLYRAWLGMAGLYRHDGDEARAQALEARAAELRTRVATAFWMPGRNYLAVALEKGGRQVRTVTSNPGHALWSGILDQEAAGGVARTLLDPQLFSGWGIRTLALGQTCYNPIDYQVGAVWPHDNALIAAGLKRYGFMDEVLQVFTALYEAATHFENFRLPELFAGFPRSQYPVPVRYPVACSPQAWAAGALPFLLTTCLGLEPDALAGRLAVRRPILPAWLSEVSLPDLRVGGASVSLHFQRRERGVQVRATPGQGRVEVHVETAG